MSKKVTPKKLTEKEKIFCKEYLKCGFNASEAARRSGYSEKTATEIAHQNLLKLHIKEEIARLRANTEEVCGISKDMVVLEHKKLAFNSIAHLHNTWIERKEFDELTDDQKACIAEISTQTRTILQNELPCEIEFIKIKLFDKQKALDSLSKLMGYDTPAKVEFSGKLDINQITGMEVEK